MAIILSIEAFLEKSKTTPIVDVRSPSEFEKGHIPGAVNVPLFSDEERAEIGTNYKQKGREEAILLGLRYVGSKMEDFAIRAKKLAVNHEILVHCWRGGMRSASMAWLFETVGIRAFILQKGYKAYRNKVISIYDHHYKLFVLGGMTGSSKTAILKEIGQAGEQVIDLEGIASHKGSAFGAIGQMPQTTTEQFENNVFEAWKDLNPDLPVWVEDESRMVGKVNIPEKLWEKMRISKVICIEIDKKLRVERLVNEYTGTSNQLLIDAVTRITEKLGGQNAKKAIDAINNMNYHEAADITLSYYDKAYKHGLSKREPSSIHFLQLETDNPVINAQKVIEFSNSIH